MILHPILLNFLINEENFLFFYFSALQNIPDGTSYHRTATFYVSSTLKLKSNFKITSNLVKKNKQISVNDTSFIYGNAYTNAYEKF
jgi:hypothetical protein